MSETQAEKPKEEYSREEFMTQFKTMETDLAEIKGFMANILKAVDNPKEEEPTKISKVKKDWIEEFFGVD